MVTFLCYILLEYMIMKSAKKQWPQLFCFCFLRYFNHYVLMPFEKDTENTKTLKQKLFKKIEGIVFFSFCSLKYALILKELH